MEIRTDDRNGFRASFKIHVVYEIERGVIKPAEAKHKYDILGHSLIMKWNRKYGRVISSRENVWN